MWCASNWTHLHCVQFLLQKVARQLVRVLQLARLLQVVSLFALLRAAFLVQLVFNFTFPVVDFVFPLSITLFKAG